MTAFYNECEPYAAQWLRNLIDAGEIAPGVVDERDIRDIHPDELAGFTQCHFFAGIGIWSLALRRAGWPDDRPIWTGSCPCQPFSAAGKRAGAADERHLWPHWFHLINERRPSVVIGEQVASKDGLGWLDLVSADLEGATYAFGASDLCAAGLGGAHIRQRLYFVGMAYPQDADGGRQFAARGEGRGGHGSAGSGQPGGLADGDRDGCEKQPQPDLQPRARCEASQLGADDARRGDIVGLADASGARHDGALERAESDSRHETRLRLPSALGGFGGLADAHDDARRQGGSDFRGRIARGLARTWARLGVGGLPFGMGHADGARAAPRLSEPAQRHEGLAEINDDRGRRLSGSGEGRPFPRGLADTDGGNASAERQQCGGLDGLEPQDVGALRCGDCGGWHNRRPELERPRAPMLGRHAADWLFCRDGKWRPVEPGTFPLAHENPSRVGRLRAYGNALDAETAQAFVESVADVIAGVKGAQLEQLDVEARAVA